MYFRELHRSLSIRELHIVLPGDTGSEGGTYHQDILYNNPCHWAQESRTMLIN